MANWGKQPSSRPLFSTALTSTTSTGTPVKSGSQTYQLRVVATAASALAILDSTTLGSSTVATPIGANSPAEYFTITPGQYYFLYGTGTVTEMS
jgi:hypothetical protein